MKQYLTITIIVIIIAVSMFILGRCTTTPEVVKEIEIKTIRDTKTVVIHDTFYYEGYAKTKYEKIYITDSITPPECDSLLTILKNNNTNTPIEFPHSNLYITGGFISTIDTIINKDTLNLAYHFPKQYFEVMLRRKPDTSKTITIEKDIIKTIKEPKAWHENVYVRVGFGTIIFITGIFIGK